MQSLDLGLCFDFAVATRRMRDIFVSNPRQGGVCVIFGGWLFGRHEGFSQFAPYCH